MSKVREIKNKITSIKSTQKITRAMELVSASKMRRAQQRMVLSKPYAHKIRSVIAHVAASHAEYSHPFLQKRAVSRVGCIVVSTDRGLCGGLNVNLFRSILSLVKTHETQNVPVEWCVIGRKGEAFFRHYGGHVVGLAEQLGDAPKLEQLIGVVRVMLEAYASGHIDTLFLASNGFINTMVQKPMIQTLLPVSVDETINLGYWDYIYEPDDAKQLLDMLLTRYVESQVYQAVVENIACEQSARMVAMKNATDNATQLIDELTLIYNKIRQANITQEIAEIIGGASALE